MPVITPTRQTHSSILIPIHSYSGRLRVLESRQYKNMILRKTFVFFLFFLIFCVPLGTKKAFADAERGIRNYQSIISGKKKIESLSPDELREVIDVHQFMKRGNGNSGDKCGAGYQKCVDTCGSESMYYDYDSGDYRPLAGTDYSSNCEDACRRGQRYCEDESKDEQCYEFKRACRNDCPSSIFDYSSSEFKLLTDVNSKCEDACRAGESACD